MTDPAQSPVILVVEDEVFIRMVAVDALADQGNTVLEAGSADEALEVIDAQDRIDLLFTDVNMPGDLNGLDLAEIAFEGQADMKLIVTSGARSMTPDEIPDHGVFLSKPYSMLALTTLVDEKLVEEK